MATTSILKGSNGIVNAGKRGVYQIWTSKRSSSQSLFRRTAHTSVYDKNIDEVPSSVVPDEMIKPESDKYWAPHPKTGVFGPASEENSAVGSSAAADNGGQNSVMEEKAWFRPTSLEDLEKPDQP